MKINPLISFSSIYKIKSNKNTLSQSSIYNLNSFVANSHSKEKGFINFQNYPFQYLNINFTSNALDVKKDEYTDFMEQYHEIYGDEPLLNTIRDIESNHPEMVLGKGKYKTCYQFPDIPDYVFAHDPQSINEGNEIKIQKKKFPEYDFGEPILLVGKYNVMKRIKGTSHLTAHVEVEKCLNSGGNEITPKMVEKYLSDLRKIKDFPQESYDLFAQKIKYLNKSSQYFDFINPNNILVDSENSEFNIIDLLDTTTNVPKKIPANQHIKDIMASYGDNYQGGWEMVFSLIGFHHIYYLDKMTEEEKNEMINISKGIVSKCFKAANKEELPTHDYLIEHLNMFRDAKFMKAYERRKEFMDLYGEQKRKALESCA